MEDQLQLHRQVVPVVQEVEDQLLVVEVMLVAEQEEQVIHLL